MALPQVAADAHADEIALSGPVHPLIGDLHEAKLAAENDSADHTGTAESVTQMRSRICGLRFPQNRGGISYQG